MTRSLAQDLRILAHSGPGSGNPGAAIADRSGHLVRRIRRRRAVRQTGVCALGVTAAAAVALGATNGPGWFTGVGHVASNGDQTPEPTGTAEPTTEPTATTEPTEAPEPTPTETTAPTEPADLTGGLLLLSTTYGLDLSCGAPFDTQVLTDLGPGRADHLTPRFDQAPTRADQPVTLINEIGRGQGFVVEGGWARMTQAILVTRDGVIVGFGGGQLNPDGGVLTISQDFTVQLGALHTCATPAIGADASGIYTVWGISSESGLDGEARTEAPPVEQERLNVSYGLSIDLATGEQWFGEFGEADEKAQALADDMTPLP